MEKLKERIYYDSSLKKCVKDDKEKHQVYRTTSSRDRDKIIHSMDFRKLQDKTQVYSSSYDVIRTRLTHSLEVDSIAQSIYAYAAYLENELYQTAYITNLKDNDLISAICLAHDIGHPPFGHIGEHQLDNILRKYTNNQVRFEGNAQNIQILMQSKYGLTKRALLGICKYGPQNNSGSCQKFNFYTENMDFFNLLIDETEIDKNSCQLEGYKSGFPMTLDAKIMELADDIAYVTHDIEDAIHYGLISISDIKAIFDLNMEVLAQVNSKDIRAFLDSKINQKITNDELKILRKHMISLFIENIKLWEDTTDSTSYSESNYYYHSEINMGVLTKLHKDLKILYTQKYIMAPQVQFSQYEASNKIEYVFEAYRSNVHLFPSKYHQKIEDTCDLLIELIDKNINLNTLDEKYRFVMSTLENRAFSNEANREIFITISNNKELNIYRFISDYISGMTDTYFDIVYKRLKGEHPYSLKHSI